MSLTSLSRVSFTRPHVSLFGRPFLGASLRALVLLAAFLTSLSASAQVPTPPAGGLPSAGRLQELHDLGQRLGRSDFEAETLGPVPPPKENLEHRFDRFMKETGSKFSQAEREVFTEAYWKGVDHKFEKFSGGMTRINPPRLQQPPASSTSTISGKTNTPGPGTLQFTDKDGNTFFVDVDQKGHYSRTVPVSDFQPVKMTLRTDTIKAAWELDMDGKWTQVSGTSGLSGVQGAMSPGTQITGSAAYALLDECNRPLLMASKAAGTGLFVGAPHESARVDQSPLRLVRLPGQRGLSLRYAEPSVHLVSDPLPPEAVREAQRQGIEHADQQFEKMQLEKIPKASRTKEQSDRLDKLNDMLKDYENAKSSPFANKDAIDIAEKATQARWLQRQAEALRASGSPGSEQAAQSLQNQAQQLMGGQTLPALRASALEPLQFSSAMTPAGSAASGTRIVTSGQSGYAMLGAPTSNIGGQPSIKGHSRLVATGDIKKQTSTELTLEPVAQLEEEPRETSSFAQYLGYNFRTGAWSKVNWSIAPRWGALDEKPPHVTTVGTDGDFEFKDWKTSANTCYKLNVSYGFDYASTPVSPQNSTRTYEMTINANPSWIAGFKPGLDLNRVQADYLKAGQIRDVQYNWTHWHTPFQDVPMISSGQISDDGYNHLAWEPPYKNFMLYGELSPGTTPLLPVSGLGPADWPNTAADPLPVLVLTGTWLKE